MNERNYGYYPTDKPRDYEDEADAWYKNLLAAMFLFAVGFMAGISITVYLFLTVFQKGGGL